MLKTTLLHPDILRTIARGGHHSSILIADGNYPAASKKGPNAELVCLQLSPGIPTVAQTLRALLSAIPIEHLHTMGIPSDDPYAKHGEPRVWAEYREIIAESGAALTLDPVLKWDFYKQVESPDHILTIQTADQALWANVLLVVGCRTD
jgi:L-fucose mutarotase